MNFFRFLIGITLSLPLAACGTYIPSQRDWPHSRAGDVERMNLVLAHSILCELSYAVTLAVENDLQQASERRNHKAYSQFLENWGVEVATDLTVSENSSISPTGIWMPSKIFSLAGGIVGSSTATNENKYNVFYPIASLYKPGVFTTDSEVRPCRDPRGNKEGSPLVDIDLRILPLLESRIQTTQLGFAPAPSDKDVVKSEKNVLTQTVSIKESVSGDITPTWKFTTGSINSSGKLFSAERDRTHQIVFTFGPLGDGKQTLTDLAEAFHINQQLKAGLRDTQ